MFVIAEQLYCQYACLNRKIDGKLYIKYLRPPQGKVLHVILINNAQSGKVRIKVLFRRSKPAKNLISGSSQRSKIC